MRRYIAVFDDQPQAKSIEAEDAVAAYAAARRLQGTGGRHRLTALSACGIGPVWVKGMGRIDRVSKWLAKHHPVLDWWGTVDFLLANPNGSVQARGGIAWLFVNDAASVRGVAYKVAAYAPVGVVMKLIEIGWLTARRPGALSHTHWQQTRPSAHQIVAWTRQRAIEAAAARQA